MRLLFLRTMSIAYVFGDCPVRTILRSVERILRPNTPFSLHVLVIMITMNRGGSNLKNVVTIQNPIRHINRMKKAFASKLFSFDLHGSEWLQNVLRWRRVWIR